MNLQACNEYIVRSKKGAIITNTLSLTHAISVVEDYWFLWINDGKSWQDHFDIYAVIKVEPPYAMS